MVEGNTHCDKAVVICFQIDTNLVLSQLPGQAAEMAGLSKRAFAELLGSYQVSIFSYPASDLSRDVSNA